MMENRVNKPGSAMAYYVKLYCKKKASKSKVIVLSLVFFLAQVFSSQNNKKLVKNKGGDSSAHFHTECYIFSIFIQLVNELTPDKKPSVFTNRSLWLCDIQRALRSWLSLSIAEKQPFIEKFRKCQEKYEENCGLYLKSVEPFMKKKTSRERKTDDTRLTEAEVHNNEDQLQQTLNTLQNTDDTVSNDDSVHNQRVYAASVIDSDERQRETKDEVMQKVAEPLPPCMNNGKELFEAVKLTGENNLQWKDLSQIERGKYQRAVLSIKRDYIKKYQKYLESLPPKELFQHYNKSLEKYY